MIEQKFNRGEVVQCTKSPKAHELHGVHEVLCGTNKTKALIIQALSHTFRTKEQVLRIEYLLWNKAGYFLAYQDVWHENKRIVRSALRSIDAEPRGAFLLNENTNDK